VTTSRIRQTKGAHPNRIADQLGGACLEFASELYRLQRNRGVGLREATSACARLYAKIARIHPFIDGNLRASFITLQVALGSLDLPMVPFPEPEAHDDAMDQALRVDSNQTYVPLASLIEEIVKTA